MRGKEELIQELERDKENQAALQQQYVTVLAGLRSEVEKKERSVAKVQRLRGQTEEEKREISRQYKDVTRELAAL